MTFCSLCHLWSELWEMDLNKWHKGFEHSFSCLLQTSQRWMSLLTTFWQFYWRKEQTVPPEVFLEYSFKIMTSCGVSAYMSEWKASVLFMWTTNGPSNKLTTHVITSLLKTENSACIQDSFRSVFAARHEEAPLHEIMMNVLTFDNRVRARTNWLTMQHFIVTENVCVWMWGGRLYVIAESVWSLHTCVFVL